MKEKGLHVTMYMYMEDSSLKLMTSHDNDNDDEQDNADNIETNLLRCPRPLLLLQKRYMYRCVD